MPAGFRIDELRGNTHPPPGLPDRSFEHISHAELAAGLLHIDDPTLIGEAQIARDNHQPADARERGNDLLGHT